MAGGAGADAGEDFGMSDSRELAAHDPGGRDVVASVDSARGMLAMIVEAARDPSVDANKMVTLAKLATDMQDRERRAEFNRAKMAAINAMPAIYKRGLNTHLDTKYAKFEDYHRAAMPVLAAHGLSLDFRIGSEGRDVTVQPILRHENGYVEEGGIMRGPPDEGKGRSSIMAVGSASSYLKRYAMRAMLNIVEDGEDTDGVMPREGDQLNDRQQGVVIDAEAAAARGEYPAWYQRQTPKDKAWLVTSGVHARVGGGAALPDMTGERREEPPAEAEHRPEPEPTREPEPRAEPKPKAHNTSTPDGWAAQYVDDMRAAKDVDAIERVKAKGAGGLNKLAAEHQRLYDKCDAAEMEARDRVAPAGADGDQFGEEEG